MTDSPVNEEAALAEEPPRLESDPEAFRAYALRLWKSEDRSASMTAFEMLQQWRAAVSRYRVYHAVWSDCKSRTKAGKAKSGYVKSEVSRGWTCAQARKEVDRLNSTLTEEGMCSPIYGMELTNVWEVMPEPTKLKAIAEGKTAKDFDV